MSEPENGPPKDYYEINNIIDVSSDDDTQTSTNVGQISDFLPLASSSPALSSESITFQSEGYYSMDVVKSLTSLSSSFVMNEDSVSRKKVQMPSDDSLSDTSQQTILCQEVSSDESLITLEKSAFESYDSEKSEFSDNLVPFLDVRQLANYDEEMLDYLLSSCFENKVLKLSAFLKLTNLKNTLLDGYNGLLPTCLEPEASNKIDVLNDTKQILNPEVKTLAFPYKAFEVTKKFVIQFRRPLNSMKWRPRNRAYSRNNDQNHPRGTELNENDIYYRGTKQFWDKIINEELRHRYCVPLILSKTVNCSLCDMVILQNEFRLECTRCQVIVHEDCVSLKPFCIKSYLDYQQRSIDYLSASTCGYLTITRREISRAAVLVFCVLTDQTLTVYDVVDDSWESNSELLLPIFRDIKRYSDSKIVMCAYNSDLRSFEIKFLENNIVKDTIIFKAESVLAKNMWFYHLWKALTTDIEGSDDLKYGMHPVSIGEGNKCVLVPRSELGSLIYTDEIFTLGCFHYRINYITIIKNSVFLLSTDNGLFLYGSSNPTIYVKCFIGVKKFIYLPPPFLRSYAIREQKNVSGENSGFLMQVNSEQLLNMSMRKYSNNYSYTLKCRQLSRIFNTSVNSVNDIVLSKDKTFLAVSTQTSIHSVHLNEIGEVQDIKSFEFSVNIQRMELLSGKHLHSSVACCVNNKFYKLDMKSESCAKEHLIDEEMEGIIRKELIKSVNPFIRIKSLIPNNSDKSEGYVIFANKKVFFIKNNDVLHGLKYVELSIRESGSLVHVDLCGEILQIVTDQRMVFHYLPLTRACEFIEKTSVSSSVNCNEANSVLVTDLSSRSKSLCYEKYQRFGKIICDSPNELHFILFTDDCRVCWEIAAFYPNVILRNIHSTMYTYTKSKDSKTSTKFVRKFHVIKPGITIDATEEDSSCSAKVVPSGSANVVPSCSAASVESIFEAYSTLVSSYTANPGESLISESAEVDSSGSANSTKITFEAYATLVSSDIANSAVSLPQASVTMGSSDTAASVEGLSQSSAEIDSRKAFNDSHLIETASGTPIIQNLFDKAVTDDANTDWPDEFALPEDMDWTTPTISSLPQRQSRMYPNKYQNEK